ncbi:TPA: NAD-dependent epimerase/dehydratase family protein [Streptococcus suis]|nr:NAD-dependent epimerase/dehydratase family protein [Streptococcus suis]
MNILILGAASFIGKNLTLNLIENKENHVTLVDKKKIFFEEISNLNLPNMSIIEHPLDQDSYLDNLLQGQDIVYHLVSSDVYPTSNQHITKDIEENVLFSLRLFDSCVRNNIKKVIFVSSGGAVYGKVANCPISEDTLTQPITSYGVQKVMIEQLLYVYHYAHGLDYRIIRLANPYGPYQRPNGVQGAVTSFTYKALKNEEIVVYGDGSVIRDYIYIDDAIKAIVTISDNDSRFRIFNLGSGKGTSVNEILKIIEDTLEVQLRVVYKEGRAADVPVNYLDMSRYNETFGQIKPTDLGEGIRKTIAFFENVKSYDAVLDDVADKVYTRDIFRRD